MIPLDDRPGGRGTPPSSGARKPSTLDNIQKLEREREQRRKQISDRRENKVRPRR